MSGGADPIRTTVRRRTRDLLWGCGLAIACAFVVGMPVGLAQQPDDVDDRPPLPPDMPKRTPTAVKYRYPHEGRVIFWGSRGQNGEQVGGIRDDEPLASEKVNGDEYRAFTEVVLFLGDPAKGFTAAELEEHATRDLTRDNLTYPGRDRFRLELLRFDGTVTKFRKIPPTKALADAGVKELYEAFMIPADEPPTRPIRFIFTQLPPGIAAPVSGDWVPVEKWAQFAGYSFKWLAYPGPNADPKVPQAGGWLRAPLLIGISFTPVPEPPPSIKLNRDLLIFRRIIDDAPIARGGDNWEEAESWNRVILHARKFTNEQLEEAALRDVSFADLFREGRNDFKLKLVHFEGRLIRLRKVEPSTRLAEAGIDAVYEAWLIPSNEPTGNPICVVISELPPGLEPQAPGKGLMNKWVAFDGYSFKLMRYESGDKDATGSDKWKRAPLLIGRTLTLPEDPNAGRPEMWKHFVPWIFGGLLLLIAIAVGLSWWFRKGDRQARREIDDMRNKNPFSS